MGATKKNNKVGPPTKYNKDVPKQLIEFFDRPYYVEVNGKIRPNMFPTIERFTFDIGIVKSTFYAWVKEYPELSNAFDQAKAIQHDMLTQLGLNGTWKEGFSKFIAVNCTDMENKTTQDISHEMKTGNLLLTEAIELADKEKESKK